MTLLDSPEPGQKNAVTFNQMKRLLIDHTDKLDQKLDYRLQKITATITTSINDQKTLMAVTNTPATKANTNPSTHKSDWYMMFSYAPHWRWMVIIGLLFLASIFFILPVLLLGLTLLFFYLKKEWGL